MTCPDYEILINKELDGSLSSRERTALETHLAVCPDCARQAEEYRLLDRLLRENITQVEVPIDLVQSVMAALPTKTASNPSSEPQPLRPKRRPHPIWRWVSVGVAAAAIVLGFSVGGWFDGTRQTQETTPPILAENDFPSGTDPILPDRPENIDASDPPSTTQEDPPDVTQPPEDQTPDTDTPDTDTPDADTETPEVQIPEQPTSNTNVDPVEEPPSDITYNSEFSLPQVTYGNTTHGAYTLLTLASVAGYDAVLPRVNANTVTFYVETEEAYLEYQVEINGAAPVFLGETESLPVASSTAGFTVRENLDYSCVEATSISGMVARNCGDPHRGLWLRNNDEEVLVSELGGGSIVSWASDGNKVLFTDDSGILHLYYVAENISLTLSSSTVHSLCWSEDGKAVVFSAYDDQTGYYSIFKVVVP